MRKVLALLGALLLAASLTPVAYAGGNSNVVYTWTITDLGQGIWGGGPLFADGSTAGNLPFSAEDGQLVFQLQPTSWSEIVPGQVVDICFSVREMRGSSGLPPAFCLNDLGLALPVTGTPIVVPSPFDPDLRTIIRVTPAN